MRIHYNASLQILCWISNANATNLYNCLLLYIYFRRNYPLLLLRGFLRTRIHYVRVEVDINAKCKCKRDDFLTQLSYFWHQWKKMFSFGHCPNEGGGSTLRKPFKYCLAWWGCTPMADKIRQTLFERLPKGRFWKNTKEMTLASLLKNMCKLVGYWGFGKTADTP